MRAQRQEHSLDMRSVEGVAEIHMYTPLTGRQAKSAEVGVERVLMTPGAFPIGFAQGDGVKSLQER